MTKLIKCIVPVFALALVMTVPGFGVGGMECDDSPQTIVLPDCSEITITTCYCEVSSGGESLAVTIIDENTDAAGGDTDCNGNACVNTGPNLADTVEIDDFQTRNDKENNATPAKNGKGHTGISCTGCDDKSATANVGASTRKNSHFDTLLTEEDETFICKVGFNTHTKANACD